MQQKNTLFEKTFLSPDIINFLSVIDFPFLEAMETRGSLTQVFLKNGFFISALYQNSHKGCRFESNSVTEIYYT